MTTNSSVNGDPTIGSHACVDRAGVRGSSTEMGFNPSLPFYGSAYAYDYHFCDSLFSFTALRGVGFCPGEGDCAKEHRDEASVKLWLS